MAFATALVLTAAGCSDDGGDGAAVPSTADDTPAAVTSTTVASDPDAALVALLEPVLDLAAELRLEGLLSGPVMVPDPDPAVVDDLAAQRERTDAAIDALLPLLSAAATADETSEGVASAIGSVQDRLEGLGVTRAAVDDLQIEQVSAVRNYGGAADSLVTVVDEIRLSARSGPLVNQLITFQLLAARTNALSEVDALLAAALASDPPDADLLILAAEDLESADQLLRSFSELAHADGKALLRNASSEAGDAALLRSGALLPDPFTEEVDLATWLAAARAELAALDDVRAQLMASLGDAATDQPPSTILEVETTPPPTIAAG